MGPWVVATLVWLGYEYGKTKPGRSMVFSEKEAPLPKLDEGLTPYQKQEVKNALYHLDDVQALRAIASEMESHPIAKKVLSDKAVAIKSGQPYQVPDFDYA